MKKLREILFTISLILIFTSATASFGQKRQKQHLYNIKSAKIEFTFINGPQFGTKTIIFDDWGDKELMITEMQTDSASLQKMIEFSRGMIEEAKKEADSATLLKLNAEEANLNESLKVQRQIVLKKDNKTYIIDLNRKEGKVRPEFFSFDNSTKSLEEMGWTIKENEMFLGKNCTVFVLEPTYKLLRWDGIALKKELLPEADALFQQTEYATSIDENYKIRKDDFVIPKGIKIVE